MKILPVLDLLDGIVVRGVAGKRDEYRPVESCLVAGAEPLDIANAFRERFGLTELYVADLDAILHDQPNFEVYKTLRNGGFDIIVDAGLRDVQRAQRLFEHGASAVIAGLETLTGPQLLRELTGTFGPCRMLFSLDLKSGQPLGDLTSWNTSDPFELGRQAVAAGASRMIVLDLASVGVERGVGTVPLCQQFRKQYPQLEIITGGGVRNADDLKRLAASRIDGVLVASALHNGGIDAETVRSIAVRTSWD